MDAWTEMTTPWPKKSTSLFYRDVLYPRVYTFVGSDLYWSRSDSRCSQKKFENQKKIYIKKYLNYYEKKNNNNNTNNHNNNLLKYQG